MRWSSQEETEVLTSPPVHPTVTCPIRKQPEDTPNVGNTGPDPWAGLVVGLAQFIQLKEPLQQHTLALHSFYFLYFLLFILF